MSPERNRFRRGIVAVLAFTIAGTGAGAATAHRFFTTAAGSEGAQGYVNTSTTGSALEAISGSTIDTSVKLPFAMLGEYLASSTQFGVGVAGISTTGYGVAAEALGVNPALYVLSKGKADAIDASATGTTGNGIDVSSTSGIGVVASAQTNGDAALYGTDTSQYGGYGVYAISKKGSGVYAEGDGGDETAAFVASSAATSTDFFDGYEHGNYTPALAFKGKSSNYSGLVNPNAASSDLQLYGDILIAGHIFSGCTEVPFESDPSQDCASQSAAIARARNGATFRTYASQHASETLEDEGEARLVNGSTHVALDPAYAATISTTAPYLVFTTAQGDCRGLFVTNRTATGFDVREFQGGRSTLTFDYRLVAHPYGDKNRRMALIVREPRTQRRISPSLAPFRLGASPAIARLRPLAKRALPALVP